MFATSQPLVIRTRDIWAAGAHPSSTPREFPGLTLRRLREHRHRHLHLPVARADVRVGRSAAQVNAGPSRDQGGRRRAWSEVSRGAEGAFGPSSGKTAVQKIRLIKLLRLALFRIGGGEHLPSEGAPDLLTRSHDFRAGLTVRLNGAAHGGVRFEPVVRPCRSERWIIFPRVWRSTPGSPAQGWSALP